MTEELVKIERPQLPERWDYEESVKKVRGFIYKWKNLTKEIAQELWIAREKLRAQGQRTDLQPLNESLEVKTWGQYCKDIGHSQMLVNRWLNRFFPPPEKIKPEPPPLKARAEGYVLRKDAIEFLRTLEEPADLLFTDPPYMTEFESNAEFVEFVDNWIPLAISKVKDTGRIYIFTGSYPKELYAYLSVLLRQSDFIFENILVWSFQNVIGPSLKMGYRNNWQAILYLYGQEAEPLSCPSLVEQFSVHEINAPDGRFPSQRGELRYSTFEKPVELVSRLISHSTREGDLVIDPFAGTGTHIIAAQELARRAIGSEIDEKMIEICKKRGLEIR